MTATSGEGIILSGIYDAIKVFGLISSYSNWCDVVHSGNFLFTLKESLRNV